MRDDLQHGGALDAVAIQFPDAPRPWVDLSTGINPWPWQVEGLSPSAFYQLPSHSELDRCAEAMRGSMSAPAGSLLLVPGTELAIRLLPRVIGARRVAVVAPGYGDHAASWRAAGAEVVESEDPLAHCTSADAVVLCNPNNPDGRSFDSEALLDAWQALEKRSAWLIVDEAFVDLSPELSLAAHAGKPGLVILRSSGKFFGVAGLRLGAVLGPPALTRSLEELLGDWRISGPALAVGARAYADLDWQQRTRERLASARATLDEALTAQGVRIAGGTDLFRLLTFPDAHATWHQLCAEGIYTRRFSWTNSHLRIGLPGTADAQQRLMRALSLASA
ncbi:MAG: threonine-phosphate decarboxylase CobD [Pseudomonadota bacterium]